MTVDEFADVLREEGLEFVGDGPYRNQEGQEGYRATYRYSGRFYWYSVSRTALVISPERVADALIEPRRRIKREYPYLNSKGRECFEATVQSGEHHFMLNAGPHAPRMD